MNKKILKAAIVDVLFSTLGLIFCVGVLMSYIYMVINVPIVGIPTTILIILGIAVWLKYDDLKHKEERDKE